MEKNPNPKRFNSPPPHLFAHRGGNAAGKSRENTLAAFQSAANLGYKFLETDVIATKDGQAVTYHGSANFFMKAIFRLELRRKVQSLTYDQLKRAITLGGETIPTLEEALVKLNRQAFCIDVKTNEAIEPMVRAINKHNAKNRVVITSFSRKRSIQANRLLYGENFNGACLCVYRLKGWSISLFPALWLNRLKRQGFGYVHIPYKCVTRRLLNEAKKRDFKIYAWTVNKQEDIERLLSWGVGGIISDEAEILIKFQKSFDKKY